MIINGGSQKILVLGVGSEVPAQADFDYWLAILCQEFGIEAFKSGHGFAGVMSEKPDIVHIDPSDLELLRHVEHGGAYRGVSRANLSTADEATIQRALERLTKYDCLVVFGGDGTARQLRELAKKYPNFPRFFVLPRTIDGDAHGCEMLGFYTAVLEAARYIRSLANVTEGSAEGRVTVAGLMGRTAPFLPLNAAIAAGAHIVLLGKETIDFGAVAQEVTKRGNQPTTILVLESVIDPATGEHLYPAAIPPGTIKQPRAAKFVAEQLAARRLSVRICENIGYNLRGAVPTDYDRKLAELMAKSVLSVIQNPNAGSGLITFQEDGIICLIPPHAIPYSGEKIIYRDEPLIVEANLQQIKIFGQQFPDRPTGVPRATQTGRILGAPLMHRRRDIPEYSLPR